MSTSNIKTSLKQRIEEFKKDNDDYIVTRRCEDAPAAIPGCIKKPCKICEKDTWVAPSSQVMNIKNIICINCLISISPETLLTKATISPETYEEVNYWSEKLKSKHT